jgi:hypothetical protein
MIEHPCPFYIWLHSLLAEALSRIAAGGSSEPDWSWHATGTMTVATNTRYPLLGGQGLPGVDQGRYLAASASFTFAMTSAGS